MDEKIPMDNYFAVLLEHIQTTEESIAYHAIKVYLEQLESVVFPGPKDPLVRKWIEDGLIK